MPTLDAETRRALKARVDFYRELGIYDLYRQPVPEAENIEARSAEVLPIEGLNASPTDRISALGAIREDIGDCTRCKLHKQRKNIVFGVGDPHARLMFVGEAPGADEDEQGEPFVGRAGQLLNNMITAMGLRRTQVYIANIAKCRPPGNRQPERDECETCMPFLMRQIDVIRPEVIVALGATSAKNLLGLNDSMINLRGRFYEFRNTKLLVTYHPAFLLRDPRQKKETWKDLRLVMEFLQLPLPAKPQNSD